MADRTKLYIDICLTGSWTGYRLSVFGTNAELASIYLLAGLCPKLIWLHQNLQHFQFEHVAFHLVPQFCVIGFGHVRLFVWHEISPWNISRTVWPRITKCHMNIRTHIPDMTSLSASSRKLQQNKNCRKCCLWLLQVEFIKNSLSKDHKISRTYWGQSASRTCPIWRRQLLVISIYRSFKKRLKMPHSKALFAFSLMQCQMHLQISWVSEEYRQRFQIKRHGVLPSPTL